MYDDSLNTKNVAIVTAGTVVALLGSVWLGVYGNNSADRSHERVAVACVTSGASWVRVPDTGAWECRR